MAPQQPQNQNYGFPQPLTTVLPPPINANRAPTVNDTGFPIGQIWIWKDNAAYILVGFAAGAATWDPVGGGAVDVATINGLPPTAGNITIAGTAQQVAVANAGSTVTLSIPAVASNTTSFTSGSFITSSATTGLTYNANTITATGSDADIDINILPKGVGVLEQSRALVGGSVTIAAQNTDATNLGSNADLVASVGGAGGGDPAVFFNVAGAGSYIIGIDNSDSDNFKISTGASLGTTDDFVLTSTGAITVPRGDVTVSRAQVGNVLLNVANTSVANLTDNAEIIVSSGGAGGGDAQIEFAVTGGGSWSVGVDNSVSDGFAIASGTSLGANNVIMSTSSGSVTFPLTPSFLGYLAVSASNKTGNGAVYTIGTDALTILFDQGSNFTTAGVFTAPVTGIYDLRAQCIITGCTVATTFTLSIVTTSKTYSNVVTRTASADDQTISISAFANMSATDTATVTITVSGEANDTDDIVGNANPETFFTGTLAA